MDLSCYLLLMDSSYLLMNSSIILPEGSFPSSFALEWDVDDVVRFLVCVKWYQSFSYFSMMAGDNDESQSLSIRVGTIKGRLNALESTMNSMIQELMRLSFKIDDRGLADGMYWSRWDCPSGNLHPTPPPHQPPPYHLYNINFHYTNHRQISLHHINRHQGVLYRIFNMKIFPMRKN